MTEDLVQCTYTRQGPKVGRLVTWRQQCRRKVRLQPGQKWFEARCWQHR